MPLREIAGAFSTSALEKFERCSKEVSRGCVENVDGRQERNHPIVIKGSYVYVAYKGDLPLYVGETGKSIRNRFITDGFGSHRKKNKWYWQVTRVRFWKLPCEDKHYRKLLEAALIFKLKPSHQGK